MKATEKYTKDEFENKVAVIALVVILVILAVWAALAIFWTPWVLLLGPVVVAMLLLVVTFVISAIDGVVKFAVECAESEGDRFLKESKRETKKKKEEDEVNEKENGKRKSDWFKSEEDLRGWEKISE